MSEHYEEIVDGETILRRAPGARHERICALLHARVMASVARNTAARALEPRSVIQLSAGTILRPDLAVVAAATGKLWLAAEIVSSDDHRPDTVLKKSLYEHHRLTRLWMIDPRYDNVETYHGTPYGLALKQILAGRELLREPLLPEFELKVNELFVP